MARGLGERRAEDGRRRNARLLEGDGIGDAYRRRGAAIAEALDDRIALGKTLKLVLAEGVLRRQLAHGFADLDTVLIAQPGAEALDEDVGVDLGVVDEADAHALELAEPFGLRDCRNLLGNLGAENGDNGHDGALPMFSARCS